MRGRDVRLVEHLAKPNQRGLPIPHAARGRREEMRLVDDDDAGILIHTSISNGIWGSSLTTGAACPQRFPSVGSHRERMFL